MVRQAGSLTSKRVEILGVFFEPAFDGSHGCLPISSFIGGAPLFLRGAANSLAERPPTRENPDESWGLSKQFLSRQGHHGISHGHVGPA